MTSKGDADDSDVDDDNEVKVSCDMDNMETTCEENVDTDPLKMVIDVSIGKKGTMKKQMKKVGSGRQPWEGARVEVFVQAVDENKAPLVKQTAIAFAAGSGQYCEAIDEGVLFMRKGEVCEIKCTCPISDDALGLHTDGSSVVTFGVYLSDFEIDTAIEEYGPGRIAHCTQRKDLGSALFKNGEWMKAVKRYSYAAQKLSPLEYFSNAEEKEEAEKLMRVCYLNAAMAWLKLDSYRDAADLCKTVLEGASGAAPDPYNVKALFRRGQALRGLGQYREAAACLKKLLEVEKDNKEAVKLLHQLREDEKPSKQMGANLLKSAPDQPAPRAPAQEKSEEELARDKVIKSMYMAPAEVDGTAAAAPESDEDEITPWKK